MPFFILSITRGLLTFSSSILPAFIGILGIGFLIGFHELGHFLFAKLFNIHTPSFSIGFGPKLISKKIGDTHFSLSAIPLGGYVELAGSEELGQGEQIHAKDRGSRSFSTKPYWQKLLVMLGGILFNLLFAYIAFILLFALGVPKSPYLYPSNASNTIASIAPDSPADKAGIRTNDTIITFEGTAINGKAMKLLELIAQNPGKTVSVDIIRDDVTEQKTISLNSIEFCGTQRGQMGITLGLKELPPRSFLDAVKQGVHETNSWIKRALQGLWCIISRKKAGTVSGPIGIIQALSQEINEGVKGLLALLAIISLNLALLNLLPLPILDGGQILFITLEAIFRRNIPDYIRMYVQLACWALIMLLVLFVSYHDIKRIIASKFPRALSHTIFTSSSQTPSKEDKK